SRRSPRSALRATGRSSENKYCSWPSSRPEKPGRGRAPGARSGRESFPLRAPRARADRPAPAPPRRAAARSSPDEPRARRLCRYRRSRRAARPAPGSSADRENGSKSRRRTQARSAPRRPARTASWFSLPEPREGLAVFFGERAGIAKHQQILVVGAFRGAGPVVRAGEDDLAVDDGEFLVHQAAVLLAAGRFVAGDAPQRNFLRVERFAFGVFVGAVELAIDHDLNADAALFRLHQSMGEIVAGKSVNRHQQLLFGGLDLAQDMRGASSLRAE